MKIVFFGSDDFAAENLQKLIDDGFLISACVTQPDRPSGRGLKVIFSPIKIIAAGNNIPLLQPEDLKDQKLLGQLAAFQADLFVIIAYGKILPSVVLKLPKLFCINVHGSLLPKYRGAAPINWAIINGDPETGFSIIKMNSKMDAGEIIVQEKMKIRNDDTSSILRERMARQSAVCLGRTITQLTAGKFTLTSQDESKVTLASKMDKELGHIDWKKSATEIYNLVRGLLPWPVAYSLYKGKTLKIFKTTIVSAANSSEPGTISQIKKNGILVSCGKDALLLVHVQPESGKPMDAASFAAGHKVQPGTRFE